ncbi:MAG TPA: hypothetical protein VEX64_06065, partial [Pyrinomonadaceae bacterium]|nr:hypothetical protein [Pyrinomonadaceae bacterium]
MEFSSKRTLFKWLAIFGIWTLGGLFFTSQFVLQNQLSQRPVAFWKVLAWQLFSGYVWFALMPLVLWLGRRFPFDRGAFAKNLAIHLVAGVLVAMIQQAVDALILPRLGYPPGRQFASFAEAYKFFLFVNLHFSILIYWSVLGIRYAVNYYQMYRERELQAAQLQNQLAQARL